MDATCRDVLEGRAEFAVECADAVAWFNSLPEGALSMVIGSPPYLDARTYGIDAQRDCPSWVAWMLEVTAAAHRATKGPVFWVVAGVTRDRNYWPGCEGLAWEWWKRGGDCQLYRPCIYRRVGIPGSGGDDYLRADWEYVLCFKHGGPLPWSDNTAMGHPPKWAPGGEMSHRLSNGQRVNGESDPWMKRDRGNHLSGREKDGRKNKGTKWGGSGRRSGRLPDGTLVKQNSPSEVGEGQVAAGADDGCTEEEFFTGEPPAKEPSKNAHGVSTDAPVGLVPTGNKSEGELYRAKTKQSTARRPNGEREGEQYSPPVLANPGTVVQERYWFTAEEISRFIGQPSDIVDCLVGGGRMGESLLVHENEAPYPERLPEFFIRSFCPPGGVVGDCFSGSGTTAAVALRWRRKFVGCDVRQSQVDLSRRRVSSETPFSLFAE